jgi:hypothetical protein
MSGLVNKQYTFKQGNLIGVTNSSKSANAIPDIIFYITKRNGKLVYIYGFSETPEEQEYMDLLVEDIKDQGYKVKDIKGLYDLPFDTSILERNAE